MKKSLLAAGLKAAAGHQQLNAGIEQAGLHGESQKPRLLARSRTNKKPTATVMVGGHFDPEVRQALFLVQAQPENVGKNLKQLLGEAINDLCGKYGKPQPYRGEA